MDLTGAGEEAGADAVSGFGGGAGMGGAIFNHSGTVNIGVCTFTGNMAEGGARGGNYFGGPAATLGGSYGPAIFNYYGTMNIDEEAVYEENTAESDAEANYVYN